MSLPQISVVVPVHDEQANVAGLLAELAATLRGKLAWEVLFVDDHSSDATLAELQGLKAGCPELRVLCHRRQCGQSRAVHTGVQAARAAWVVTLDGDGQNDPADIHRLLAEREQATADVRLFAGWRVERRDTGARRWASRWANAIRAGLLGDATPDTGCGIKLFEREAFLALPYFDHMHRYLPALMQRAGWTTLSVPVNHRQRTNGVSKYTNFSRAVVGIRDLLGVQWLLARARRSAVVEL